MATENGCDIKYNVADWCANHTNQRTISTKVINNFRRGRFYNMIQLKKAGLISDDAYPFNPPAGHTDAQLPVGLMLTESSAAGTAAVSSWNKSGRVNFRGWLPREDGEVAYQFYKDKLANHNFIITYLSQNNTTHSVQDPRASFVPAKMASELDAKIDDGRPGTGRVLGIKAGLSVPTAIDTPRNGTEDEQKQVCFDRLDTSVEDIDKAIYHSSTDLKYGCNLVKVMEDVK